MYRCARDQVSLQEFVSCASLVDDLHIATWCQGDKTSLRLSKVASECRRGLKSLKHILTALLGTCRLPDAQ